jgi:hypothetical protein
MARNRTLSVRVMKDTRPDMETRLTKLCDECGSEYFVDTSRMDRLCPECAHWLYGYGNCEHAFSDGRCRKCFWDGSVSEYLRKMKP